uniref:INO80 complex subunit E N-terminal domain-containing protein n=1 Tax=Clastoptera arizonana TaxID=38151 RepID=A0A1B6CH19_9HEMI
MVANNEDDDDSQEEVINYKAQYRNLKRKLKFLIYENECFQEALRSTQRRLLKASRDKSFLLDRLLTFEKVEVTSSEGEDTESSDDGESARPDNKRRKVEVGSHSYNSSGVNSSGSSKTPSSSKKKKPTTPKPVKPTSQQQLQMVSTSGIGDSMSHNAIDHRLDSHQPFLDIEKNTSLLPSEIFNNDPSLDRYSE